MSISRRVLLGSAAAAATVPTIRRARAANQTIKIGVLNDQSGPYRDTGGLTSIACARQAAEEFGNGHGFDVEIVSADHQNKPDIGASIARQWFDRDGVDMLMDVPTSSVALAVSSVCHEKNKAYVNISAGTTDLTGKQCQPTNIHWSYDTHMLARSTGGAMVKAGGDTWYFITADYVFGQQLARDATTFVLAGGGKVLGNDRYPFPGTTDFSSYMISAQSSGAKVLGLANAGADTVNCIKQAHEFGLTAKMKIAAMLMYITDVNAVGLDTAQGLSLTESFYWDMNDRTRAFTKRVQSKIGAVKPNMNHAGNYAASLHYLKAVAGMGAVAAKASGADAVAKMKSMPTDDDAFGTGHKIREDGWVMIPAFLFEVKKPAESKYAWDYYKLVLTTSPDDAAVPLAQTGCALVHA